MEKMNNKQRRADTKCGKLKHNRRLVISRNIILLAASVMLIAAGIILAKTYSAGNNQKGMIQKADYMNGETESIKSVKSDDAYNIDDNLNAAQINEEYNDNIDVLIKDDKENAGTGEGKNGTDTDETGIGKTNEEINIETNIKEGDTDKEKAGTEESKKIVEKALSEKNESYNSQKERRSMYKKLDVKNILQYPELPTGCEITALTIVLNYLGYDVDKLTMADEYLDKGEVGSTSPYKAFVGNPRDEDSCGTFAPVIVKSARKYLNSVNSDKNVYNVTGADYDELVGYVNQGHPVLVWETMWMTKPHEAAEWEVDGETITWLSHEHAMVLIGYTYDTYIMADPLRGIYEYDKDVVESRYEDMGKQAIVIY